MAVNHERQLIKTQFKPTRLADGCSVQAAALLTPPATGAASPPEPSVCRQDPEDQHSRGGTFALTYRGETTVALAWDASADAVKEALEKLSTVSTVSVTLTAGNTIIGGCRQDNVGAEDTKCVPIGGTPAERLGYRYEVTFAQDVGNVGLIGVASSTKLLPAHADTKVSVETVAGEAGSSAHIMTLKADDKCSVFDNGAYLSATYTCQNIGRTFTPDVQTVTTTTRPTTGKFRISFNGDHTADIDWATASSATQATAEAAVKAAIEALATVGTVGVTRATLLTGWQWSITFQSKGYFGPVPSAEGFTPTPRVSGGYCGGNAGCENHVTQAACV